MATTTGTGPPPVVAASPAAHSCRVRRVLRASLLTTPGRLRLLSVCLVIGVALAWAADISVVSGRHHALSTFGGDSEPLVVLAQRVQTDLSQADASAANGFLAGALEPADEVARYQQGTTQAAADIAQAARDTGTGGPTGLAVRTLAEQLPVYTGLVQTAVADNRQGFPVGAAYLRVGVATPARRPAPRPPPSSLPPAPGKLNRPRRRRDRGLRRRAGVGGHGGGPRRPRRVPDVPGATHAAVVQPRARRRHRRGRRPGRRRARRPRHRSGPRS